MPSISATVVPQPGYVVVETNFADVSGAEYVCVEREDVLTGERFPLRPYVAYDAEGCQMLSCGQAILWDTEAPMDRVLRYCATARTADGQVITTAPDPLLLDSFTRNVAAGSWGTADTGQAYTVTGTAADFSVNGTQGLVAQPVVNSLHRAQAGGPWLNAHLLGTLAPTQVATGANITLGYALRRDVAANNCYIAEIQFTTAATMTLRLRRNVGGVATTLTSVALPGTYTAATRVQVRLEVWGSQLKVSAWDATLPEPAWPMLSATDTTITAPGQYATRSIRDGGNTNVGLVPYFDDVLVTDPCADVIPVEVCSQEVIVPSGGCFRLGDPVRPCNDRVVCLEGDGPCSPDGGIFFGSMGQEGFADNSGQMLPINSRRPVVVSRRRRDVATTLTLVTATFADRDALRDLNEPGSPLLWRGPADYGTGDRYMSVTDVTETRSFIDHREQPRVVEMPHLAVDAPVGPSQGVCGTRVADLCDRYATWDDLAAAGLTWADLLRGAAGSGVEVTYATWSDVNAAYASWNALNAGESDWDDVTEGIG